jgi:hypothetical protein
MCSRCEAFGQVQHLYQLYQSHRGQTYSVTLKRHAEMTGLADGLSGHGRYHLPTDVVFL